MKISYSVEKFGRRGCGNRKENERMLILEKRIKEDPNDFEALLEKGFLCIGGPFMSPDEALECLEKAVELRPDNVDALFWLAKTYHHDFCDDDKTLELLERALTLAPDRADLHSLISDIFHRTSPEKAVYHLKRAIELEPTWIFPRTILANYLLEWGYVEKAKHEVKEAYKVFKDLKKPELKNSYDEYYERCVTGRASVTQEDFDELSELINK